MEFAFEPGLAKHRKQHHKGRPHDGEPASKNFKPNLDEQTKKIPENQEKSEEELRHLLLKNQNPSLSPERT